MDIQMPGLNGVDAIQGIQNEFANARINVLTTYAGDIRVMLALRGGGREHILKGPRASGTSGDNSRGPSGTKKDSTGSGRGAC